MIRRRVINIAGGLAMLIGLAAMAAWFGSMHYRYAYLFQRHGVAYAIASVGGRIVIDNEPERVDFAHTHPRRFVIISSRRPNGLMIHSTSVIPYAPPPLVSHTVAYYWMIVLAALALPSIVLIRRAATEDRRRRGDYPTCGYNLTGNTSGVCPECGMTITAAGTVLL